MTVTAPPLRIATRASQLALWQANHIADRLRGLAPERTIELVHVTTSGDRDQTGALASFGGVGVFTREVQRAVLDGRADLAVHSLKDLPTEPVDGLVLAAVPERAPRFDALILPSGDRDSPPAESHRGDSKPLIAAMSAKARIGTGSLRRQAQLRHLRPDLELLEIRGNVDTRLRKLDEGAYDAIILAEAGLRRLGLDARISGLLAPPVLYPSVGQGALGIECRASDDATRAILARLTDATTHAAVLAERALLAELRAGCHAPLGVSTTVSEGSLTLEGVVLSPDGTQRLLAKSAGDARDPELIGRAVAEELRRQGAGALIGAG